MALPFIPYMRANLRRDIYSQELCQAAGASERGLRYAFDDLLGIPPNRYLAMLRLCTAHRSLVTAEADSETCSPMSAMVRRALCDSNSMMW